MYSNLNKNYYRINHEKSLEYFDTSSFAQIKSLLFCELAEIDTATVSNNIIILFNSITKYNNTKDKLEFIINISEQYSNNYEDSLSLYLCQKLSKKNFHMSFTLSKDNITEVAIVLSIGLRKINKQKIKNKSFLDYDKFIENIGKYKNMRLDMIPFYKNYNVVNINDGIMVDKYDIPNELLLLIDIFQKVKKLEFKIGDYSREAILGILLILLNYNWLFPYVFEIEFNLNYIDLHKEIEKKYLKKIEDKIDLSTNINTNKKKKNIFKDIQDNLLIGIEEYEIKNIDNINLQKYSNTFELIIIYTYFIDKFKFLNNLEIKISDCFKKEIENYFNSQKKTVPIPPNPLELFFSINNLNYLKIEFNALDSNIFENIFSLIQNNSNLKIISLDLFPNEMQYKNFNSLSNLLKLSEENSNDSFLIRKKTIKLNNNYNDNIKEIKKFLLNQLIENFENNMEKLFILLQTKKNLDELILIFNEPNILLDDENEDYYLILLKFIYNIIIMINKEIILLKKIKIISKFFRFDNNKNNSINQFLNGINLHEKNKYLINFELQLQINNIINISNLISYNFKKIYLGSIDKITLSNLVSFYKNKKYIENSQLFSLIIELNENILSYENCKEELTELLKSECPKKMYELGVFCKFNINKKDLGDLVINGNRNSIHKYIFKIKGMNNGDENDYDEIINNKNIYYIDKEFINAINRYIGLIIKYNFHTNEKVKIAKKIFKFLIPSNRKIVDINFI